MPTAMPKATVQKKPTAMPKAAIQKKYLEQEHLKQSLESEHLKKSLEYGHLKKSPEHGHLKRSLEYEHLTKPPEYEHLEKSLEFGHLNLAWPRGSVRVHQNRPSYSPGGSTREGRQESHPDPTREKSKLKQAPTQSPPVYQPRKWQYPSTSYK